MFRGLVNGRILTCQVYFLFGFSTGDMLQIASSEAFVKEWLIRVVSKNGLFYHTQNALENDADD